MSIDRQKWDFDYFNLVCALLAYWTEHEIDDNEKAEAQKALNGVITYSNVVKRENDEFVRVAVTPNRWGYISMVIGRYQVGLPDKSDLDFTVDYLSMSEQETQEWKERIKARREANRRFMAEQKEARRLAKIKEKEEADKRDMKLIKDYMNDRKGISIIKARMARELNIPYNRCLKLCKQLE